MASTQPCDAGIIKKLKHFYCGDLLRKILSAYDNNAEFDFTLYDAMHLLQKAWVAVKQETIQNCFRHCGFMKSSLNQSIVGDSVDLVIADEPFVQSEFRNVFERMRSIFNIPSVINFDTFTAIDDEVVVAGTLTDEQLICQSNEDVVSDSDSEILIADVQPPPSNKEAYEAVKLLKRWIAANECEDGNTMIDTLEDIVDRVTVSKTIQSTLDKYILH